LNTEAIRALDEGDVLAEHRKRFKLPANKIYLDGNSLGPLADAASARASAVVQEQWGEDLISSWNKHSWIELPAITGNKIARLIGAAPGQVICCDSISVNLFKLLCQCLLMQEGRRVVLSQQDNFPTDLYITQGVAGLLGADRCEPRFVAEEDLLEALNPDVAVLMLSQVNFRTGKLHDIKRLTHAAHEQGILVIWDLAHSAGVLELAMDEWQVDFAVGCGYKFLNGGPGAPAFIYANSRHHAVLDQPVKGWMGHKAPFEFDPVYSPQKGMESFLVGTPPVLSMAVLDAALDEFSDVTVAALRQKSVALTELFIELVADDECLTDLMLASPAQAEWRGSQVAYAHPHAWQICQALAERGVIADFRSPDLLRFGFSPLILSFADIADSVGQLGDVLLNQDYSAERFQSRARVT
jgi:kynureninase